MFFTVLLEIPIGQTVRVASYRFLTLSAYRVRYPEGSRVLRHRSLEVPNRPDREGSHAGSQGGFPVGSSHMLAAVLGPEVCHPCFSARSGAVGQSSGGSLLTRMPTVWCRIVAKSVLRPIADL